MLRWLRPLLRREQFDRELKAELLFHVEQQARDYMAAGISEAEAHRRARLDLGGARDAVRRALARPKRLRIVSVAAAGRTCDLVAWQRLVRLRRQSHPYRNFGTRGGNITTKPAVIVKDAQAEAALGEGWSDRPIPAG